MDLSENYAVKSNRVKSCGVTKKRKDVTRNVSVGSEMTSQLRPFKPVMIKQLKKRGFDTRFMSFKDIVPLYYNEFVSNLKNKKSNLVPINTFEFSENPVFKFGSSDNLNGDIFTHQNRQYFNQVAAITDNIIGNFRASKLKVQMCGLGSFDLQEQLTSDEILQGKAALKIEKDLETKAAGEKPITVKNLLIIGAVVLLLYYMFN